MTKRALSTAIYICWAILVACAVLKLFFDDWFVVIVNNPKLIEAGNFIDNHVWLQIIINSLLGVVTWHFYLCSCCQKWYLIWWQYIVISVLSIVTAVMYVYIRTIALVIDICLMILMPCVLKSNYKNAVTIFIAHHIGQLLILLIRGAALYLADVNYLTQSIIQIDMYIWLALYYLYANKFKEVNLWEDLAHHCSTIILKMKSKKKSKS